MTPPLRVLVVVPAEAMGGAERMLVRLLEPLGDRIDVEILSLAGGAAAAELGRRWPTTVSPVGPTAADVARGATALARRLRRRPVDVVVANGVKAAAVAVPAGAWVGTPTVWVKHDFFRDGVLSRVLGRLAAAVVANSSATAAGAGSARTVVIPPPRPERVVPARPRHDTRRVVACVGRLVPYKGFEDVVAALAHPGAEGWEVVVCGTDDPAEPGGRARIEALARELAVGGRVHLLGAAPDVAEVLAGADAVAVPTRTAPGFAGEGHSMVADEAVCAGVPVLVVGGTPLATRLGDAAVTVESASPASVAAALRVLADGEAHARGAAAARRLAADLPSAAECATRFGAVLAAAAGRPGAGLPGSRPVSVVLPVLNEAAALPALVGELAAQLRPDDEILVVDGPSTDGTGEVLAALAAAHPLRVVTTGEAAGPGAARNVGVAAAAHDVIACTDAGCWPQPGWLDALRAAFDECPPPDLVTGVYEVTADRSWQEAFRLSSYPDVQEAGREPLGVRLYGRLLGRVFDPSLPTGRSMAFTRAAWESVGGFPPTRTAEDTRFGRLLVERGGAAVLSRDAVVTWRQRERLVEAARMYRSYGRGDGQSRDPLLVGRNVARAAAYPLGAAALVRGPRAVAAAAAAVYLSVPVRRAVRARSPMSAVALVPVVLAVKDLAKVAGCLEGLRRSPAAPAGGRR